MELSPVTSEVLVTLAAWCLLVALAVRMTFPLTRALPTLVGLSVRFGLLALAMACTVEVPRFFMELSPQIRALHAITVFCGITSILSLVLPIIKITPSLWRLSMSLKSHALCHLGRD